MGNIKNVEIKMDKDILDAIDQLQKLIHEKGYDFLLVVGERVKREDAGKMLEKSAMSAIVNESEVPVLPSALMGVCSQSAAHRKFVEDLMTIIVNMREKFVPFPLRKGNKDDLAN